LSGPLWIKSKSPAASDVLNRLLKKRKKPMNLGDICLKSAFVLIACGLILGAILTVVFLLAKRKRVHLSTILLGTVLIGSPLCCLGLYFGHAPLFRAWHRIQNDAVPAEGCLTYEPTFFLFHATYEMDRQAFDTWVASHPWKLAPFEPDAIFEFHDGPYFGLEKCEAVYESPRGPKGNNLRVYYNKGIAYISYSAM
jgi:hypothetical protein